MVKDIEGYEGKYTISDRGEVYSCLSEKIKVPRISAGYFRVQLWNDGESKNHFIHRLVASAFVSKGSGILEVNHKDGDKLNNDYKNLEWVTRSENLKHAHRMGLKSSTKYWVNKTGELHTRSKRVYMYDGETGEYIKSFGGGREAARVLGCDQSTVSKALTGKWKTRMGYYFSLSRRDNIMMEL